MNLKRFLSTLLIFALLSSFLPVVFVSAQDGKLSVGKSYTVEYDSKIDNAFPKRAYSEEGALTDGRLASTSSYADSAFLKLYRGTKVIVTIDLEKVCSVSSVEVRTLQNKGAGIDCPRYVHVAVSEDGSSFGTVGSLIDETSVTLPTAQNITQKVVLDQPYKARFVRVTFSCDVYVYCDEVTVYGSESVGDAASAAADAPTEDMGFAAPIDGINNIVLMYTVGNYTEATLKPYVAYVDTKGDASDLMFDSMLFLPSGASGYDFGTQKGWDDYTENLFGIGKKYNLEALNSLVGKLRDQLSLGEDYRYPVFLSVPYLESVNASIDGIVPNTFEKRLEFLKKYVDRLISTFASAGFENLDFKGVYWHHEVIAYTSSAKEDDLIKQYNEYVHSKSLKSIWIPYYCAPGFETAMELGFDCATLQSGYAFPRSGDALTEIGDVLPGAVDDSAAQAKKYGLGMEFEFNINAGDAAKRFYKYIHTGYSSGCMENGVMMLYQAVTDLYQCAVASASSDNRSIYDLLYLYINKEFTSEAPVIESNGALKVLLTGKRTSGSFPVIDKDSVTSDLKIAEVSATEGLTYVLEGDGFYLVNTKDTAPGRYSITFRVTDGYNVSDASTVDFLVIDAQTPEFTLELDSDLTLFVRDDEAAETVSLPVGTSVSVRWVDDSWLYVNAKIDGETVDGFVKATALPHVPKPDDNSGSVSQDSTVSGGAVSQPSDEEGGARESSVTVILIAVGVAIALGVAVALVLIFRKKKKA